MRHVSSRIARTAAVLVLIAITTQAVAAPVVKERDRLSIREIVKRFVIKAFDQLGCPPG